jgi:acetyltransferase-like isoleucine patch superfamily enzyme
VHHQLDPVGYFRSIGVSMGEDVEIFGSWLYTFGTEPYLVSLGSGVTISDAVTFITHDGGLRAVRDLHPGAYLYAPIVVKDRAFIGARAIILPGVTIGRRAVIGAGAVVTRSVPDETVAVGVPARPVRSVYDYWESSRDRIVSTEGLNREEKRALLTRMVPVPDQQADVAGLSE